MMEPKMETMVPARLHAGRQAQPRWVFAAGFRRRCRAV